MIVKHWGLINQWTFDRWLKSFQHYRMKIFERWAQLISETVRHQCRAECLVHHNSAARNSGLKIDLDCVRVWCGQWPAILLHAQVSQDTQPSVKYVRQWGMRVSVPIKTSPSHPVVNLQLSPLPPMQMLKWYATTRRNNCQSRSFYLGPSLSNDLFPGWGLQAKP